MKPIPAQLAHLAWGRYDRHAHSFVCVCVCVFVHKVVRDKSCPRNRKEQIKTKRQEGLFTPEVWKLLRVLQMPHWDFCSPLVSFTLLSVFSSFTRLDSNGCPVAPGNQIWPTVNHFVWFDRPCRQPLLLLLDRTSVSLLAGVHLQNTKRLVKKTTEKMDYAKMIFGQTINK